MLVGAGPDSPEIGASKEGSLTRSKFLLSVWPRNILREARVELTDSAAACIREVNLRMGPLPLNTAVSIGIVLRKAYLNRCHRDSIFYRSSSIRV